MEYIGNIMKYLYVVEAIQDYFLKVCHQSISIQDSFLSTTMSSQAGMGSPGFTSYLEDPT